MLLAQEAFWKLSLDGASRTTTYTSGVVILFISPQGDLIPHAFTIARHCFNNIAEYQAIIMGMEIALSMGIRHLKIFGDSKLIVNQVNEDYEVRKPDILPYHRRAKSLMPQFAHVTVTYIARSLNSKADALASIAIAMAMPVRGTMKISSEKGD